MHDIIKYLLCFYVKLAIIDDHPYYSVAGVAIEGHLGRPEAGKRFSQYSRRALGQSLAV